MLPAESKYPSSSEFHFQLTEKAIGSPLTRRQQNGLSRLSLEYTLSQISIEKELEDEVGSLEGECVPYSSLKDRECGYVTASTRHTLASAVKSSFPAASSRAHSCRQHASLQKVSATIALCPLHLASFPARLPARARPNSRENFRLRKSISVRTRRNSENLPQLANRFVLESKQAQASKQDIMRRAFKTKTISLQQNEARGKIYMKKLIQNRVSILHISETCELSPWISKKQGF